ncbi:MAG: TolC family protein, partial [Desulfobacterota bacterium]|nr:TolC family protein [Thermodesulfobacteriota bacterium]
SISPYGGSFRDSWKSLRHADGYEWNIGLTFEFPIGNRIDRSRYQRAKLFKEQSVLDLKNLEDAIDLEIKVALENINRSRERIQVSEQLINLAEKSLRQEEKRMKAGLSDTFRTLIFQANLIDAKAREVQARADYQKALAQLYRAMGTNIQRHNLVININVPEK